ncbi:S8 family serine peptidase [Fictibacillus nanhaiensis]|uniref:S8 family serine peptidase n=1 Tax=Fictibacillus nanhaiensis TaxID=742169 RepID=UPI002E20C795|nr:S8 family serine peptidase [Fictibacillus nanhaiensis]MED1862383.1 S8 family serine peptidase [Fictibacillus nanhaiensis]
MKKISFIKKSTALTLAAGLLLSPSTTMFTQQTSAAPFQAEDILASLTAKQREALKQLELTDVEGLQGFKKEELQSEKEISVIVQFQSKPGQAAVLDAQLKGKKISRQQADSKVDQEHAQFKKDVEALIPSIAPLTKKSTHRITSTYKTVYNGVAMKLPANQVETLLQSESVKAIYKDVTFKVDPIAMGEEKALNSNSAGTSVESIPYLKIDQLHNEGITGEGVKVGILDTGIDYNHPDLKEAYKGGYDFVDNDSDPMETTYKNWQDSKKPEFNGNAYYTSHGTHVAGTIAGQGTNPNVSVQGVAPDADIYAYRVLGPYGTGSSEGIIAGIEKAVKDGMDVINLSLGAGINDPYYPTSTAINYAVLNDVTAVVSAGNSGPNAYTLGSPGAAALALTIGASDVPMTVASFKGSVGSESGLQLTGLARHYADRLNELQGKSYDLVDVGLGKPTDYTGKDVKGKIALIARGETTLNEKVTLAKQNGAVAVLLYNNVDGVIEANLGESTTFIPSFSLTKVAGEKIKTQISAGKSSFTFGKHAEIQTEGDRLAAFSSRGPARQTYDMKPEVTAPGVAVLSTVPSYMVNPANQANYDYAYSRYSGTSMAAPHTAGIAALMLDANPNLEPEDVKTILMNTADPLNGDYSVFEVGAGRVDPYQAVYSGTSFQVNDETLIPSSTNLVKIKERTGGIAYGSHYAGEKLSLKKSITVLNNEKVKKTFKVEVEETKGSPSLKKNGIEISIPDEIKIAGDDFKKVSAGINIPKKAKEGIYEGYITLTNQSKAAEHYRIPFSVRITEEGYNKLELSTPAIAPNYLNTAGFFNYRSTYTPMEFNFKSPMEKMEVVLQDGKSGKDLGLIGIMNLEGRNENQSYYVINAFSGMYNKFTGDKTNPVDSEVSYAPAGYYKLKFISTTATGKQLTDYRHAFIDIDEPTFESSLDGDSPFLEYKPGQETYPFDIKIKDPLVDEMKKVGLNVDQSSNSMIYYWNTPFPSSPIKMDNEGRFVEEIAMNENVTALNFRMDGFDLAGNPAVQKNYYFVKEGTPVSYTKSKKVPVKTGDAVKATVVLDNLNDLTKAEWNFNNSSFAAVSLIDAKLTDAFKDKATIVVKDGIVTVEFKDGSGTLDHAELVEVTLKVNDDYYATRAAVAPIVKVTDNNANTSTVLQAQFSWKVKPQFSTANGYVTPEGFENEAGTVTERRDWTKVGGTVQIIDAKGNAHDPSTRIADNGQYKYDKLPLQKEAFTVEMRVPGHFLTKEELYIGFEHKGELYAQSRFITALDVKAGDVNQDNVIDIHDAIEIQNAWGTGKRAADINFDGKVDAKDMKFVQKNYLLQNQHIDDTPSPRKKYQGKTLETILVELGIQQ